MIGRKKEREYLQSLVEEKESQFVAVFGRRRIGKTYLVRESFDHSFTFEHTGISNPGENAVQNKKAQLDKFAESLEAVGYSCPNGLNSWNEAFNGLKEVIIKSEDKKKLVFIDELSWMDTKDSGFISALKRYKGQNY